MKELEQLENIGDRIKYLRVKLLDLSQEQFTDRIGRNTDYYGYISRVENNKRNPTLDMLFPIIKEFGVQPDWIISNKGDITFNKDMLVKIDFSEFGNIGKRINYLRISLGISIDDFVGIVGMSASTLYKLERHGISTYKKVYLYRIVKSCIDKFGLSANWLLLNIGEMSQDVNILETR